MLIKRPDAIRASEITDEGVYRQRRRLLQLGCAFATAGALAALASESRTSPGEGELAGVKKGPFGTDEEPTPYEDVTRYNNFYEFGTDKTDPARNAEGFRPRPWSVAIDGEVEKGGTFDLEDLLRGVTLEERIYRLRCVEAWSMVIPWVGFPLADLIKRAQPTSKAKYVAFETLYDPEQMPGQRRPLLDWPYREGLRMDEAMHPLTILAVGLYGRVLPNQNGAPLRLVVPWKYGFKSIKSIVRIQLVQDQPATTWTELGPQEYGFFANVNPEVDHPRWSQKKERRIGDGIFSPKRDTLAFNGYGEQVADLYRGMDLQRYF